MVDHRKKWFSVSTILPFGQLHLGKVGVNTHTPTHTRISILPWRKTAGKDVCDLITHLEFDDRNPVGYISEDVR